MGEKGEWKKKEMEIKLFCSSAGVSEDEEGEAWPGSTTGYLFNLVGTGPETSDPGACCPSEADGHRANF